MTRKEDDATNAYDEGREYADAESYRRALAHRMIHESGVEDVPGADPEDPDHDHRPISSRE